MTKAIKQSMDYLTFPSFWDRPKNIGRALGAVSAAVISSSLNAFRSKRIPKGQANKKFKKDQKGTIYGTIREIIQG